MGAINKVIFGSDTLIDLTEDTVSPETLGKGVTAHDKSGVPIVGTLNPSIDPSKIVMVTRNGHITLSDINKINIATFTANDSVESIVYDDNIIWQNTGTLLKEMSIGDSIYLTVNGEDVEFEIVYQGNPSSSQYGSNADGTWIHAKNIYTNCAWNASAGNLIYADSTIDNYCNNTFYNLIADSEKTFIKEINVPYGTSNGSDSTSECTKVGYIQRKIFIPSQYEILNYSNYMFPTLGVYLGYYTTDSSTYQKYYNGGVAAWWTRSILAYTKSSGYGNAVLILTNRSSKYHTSELGVVPMMVLDSNVVINALGKIVS